MKRMLITVLILALSAGLLGGLWAQTGTTSVTATTTGTGGTGGSVTPWTGSGNVPDWFPIEAAVGVIDADHTDDGDGGGLATIKVPTAPAGSYRITIFLTDPDAMVASYSYLNLCMKVVAAIVASNALTQSGSSFTGATSLIDHDGSGAAAASDWEFLTPEKGFVSFIVSSASGTQVDASDRTTGHTSLGTIVDRAFNIGIRSGSLFTKSASGDLSPNFSIEVSQS